MEALTWSMHRIGLSSQKDTIIMRIITVGTLLYLPATFVSTFFSTDVIKYQNQNQNQNTNDNSDATNGTGSQSQPTFNGSFSEVAMVRWVQVTLPLTALTLGLAYLFFKIA